MSALEKIAHLINAVLLSNMIFLKNLERKMNSPITNTRPKSYGIEINKVLRNTYMLLAMTLAFSALTATLATMMQIGATASLVLMLVGFGTLFVVSKNANSSKGIFWVF
ncbi:MAG: modulator of FtsH protease, partial [Psychromonas sp.]